MTIGMACLCVFGGMAVAAVVLGIMIMRTLNRGHNVQLVSGKLENSDTFIRDALSYLKITNERSEDSQ